MAKRTKKQIITGITADQVVLNAPEWSSKDYICIDTCLKDEVLHLWSLGIETNGCCCGHNIKEGYIGVYPEYVNKMKELGYEVQFNPCRPDDEDSFKPKSLS